MIDPGPLAARWAIPSHRSINPAYQSCLPLAAKCDSSSRSRAPIRATSVALSWLSLHLNANRAPSGPSTISNRSKNGLAHCDSPRIWGRSAGSMKQNS